MPSTRIRYNRVGKKVIIILTIKVGANLSFIYVSYQIYYLSSSAYRAAAIVFII